MSNNERLRARIQEAIGEKKIVRRRMADDGSVLRVGQLWSAGALPPETPTWGLLLLEEAEQGIFNAAPFFRWGEMAGPHDVYVPGELCGATMLVALDLEASIEKSALEECHGRLSPDALAYVLAARDSLEDESSLNYSWGPEFIGEWEARFQYHQAIGSHLETLQAPIRETIWERESEPVIIPFPYSYFRDDFNSMSAPAAADSGERYTPCLVASPASRGTPSGQVREARPRRALYPKILAFDPLKPGENAGICCEWWLEETIPSVTYAQVYVADLDRPVGTAQVFIREGGMLIQLKRATLPTDAPAVNDSMRLRLALL